MLYHLLQQSSQLRHREPSKPRCCRNVWANCSSPEHGGQCISWLLWLFSASLSSCCSLFPSRMVSADWPPPPTLLRRKSLLVPPVCGTRSKERQRNSRGMRCFHFLLLLKNRSCSLLLEASCGDIIRCGNPHRISWRPRVSAPLKDEGVIDKVDAIKGMVVRRACITCALPFDHLIISECGAHIWP